MDRLLILAPAVFGVAFMVGMFGVYCVLCSVGRVPAVDGLERRKFTEIFGPFLVRYMFWLIRPVERAFAGRISPNTITLVSMAACAASGAAAALGHLATAAWMYLLAGILDILDGRLARLTGKQTQAGALFDSVADRWGELFVFAGFAWYFRHTPWLFVVMLTISGSMMVSYTRARGEGLGIGLDGGMMQRAERIALVVVGLLAAAWLGAGKSTAGYAAPTVGWTLLVVGVASTWTAVGRWIEGYKKLLAKEAAAAAEGRDTIEVLSVEAPRPESRRVERPLLEENLRVTGRHTA